MKVRIKFAKYGVMKFIGHLDVMRYFQKSLRRAEIDVKFSEGMSPHMIMSFAAPLGVGLTSGGEYMDIELRTPVTTEEALRRLNAVMVEGMEVLDFRQIEEGKAGKAMSLVAAADYTVRFREGKAPEDGWQDGLEEFFARPAIAVRKETKKGAGEVDIRPMIYRWELDGETLFLRLATGSAANLKPELVMEAYASWKGFSLESHALEINRCEIYADLGEAGSHRFVSLNDLGKPVTEEPVRLALPV